MRPVKKDSINQSVIIRIIDATTGIPEQGVEHDTAGIDLWYRREGATRTAITEAALAALDTAHTDGGIEHIDDGYYRLDPPDAAFATGCNGVMFGGAVTDMIVIGCYIPLVDCDPYDAVRMGMTALPNAAADAAGGLPISDAGGLDLDSKLANTNEVTAARMGALTDWINGGRLDLLLDAIPTTAMRGTDNAALASVVGALDNVAAAGDPTSADTLMQYIKQLINVLIGTAGIGSFPAEAAPANAVSLAEVIRAIHVDVTGLNGDAMRGTDSALTDKTGFSFSDAGIDAVFDRNSSISISFESLLERIYQMTNNKMTVNETTGAVALRNIGDSADLATGNVASSSGTTTRAELF